ncbi:hypothetical protein CPC08DRAFT_725653, partial [Agrocybe pediades]
VPIDFHPRSLLWSHRYEPPRMYFGLGVDCLLRLVGDIKTSFQYSNLEARLDELTEADNDFEFEIDEQGVATEFEDDSDYEDLNPGVVGQCTFDNQAIITIQSLMSRNLPSQFDIVEQPASPRVLTTQLGPSQPAASTSRNGGLERGESSEGSSSSESETDSLDSFEKEFPIHRVLPNNDWEEHWITFRSKMDKLFESYQRKDKGPEEHWITFRSKMNKLFEGHWRKDEKVIKYLARQVQRYKRLMKVAIQQQTGVVEENGEL